MLQCLSNSFIFSDVLYWLKHTLFSSYKIPECGNKLASQLKSEHASQSFGQLLLANQNHPMYLTQVANTLRRFLTHGFFHNFLFCIFCWAKWNLNFLCVLLLIKYILKKLVLQLEILHVCFSMTYTLVLDFNFDCLINYFSIQLNNWYILVHFTTRKQNAINGNASLPAFIRKNLFFKWFKQKVLIYKTDVDIIPITFLFFTFNLICY